MHLKSAFDAQGETRLRQVLLCYGNATIAAALRPLFGMDQGLCTVPCLWEFPCNDVICRHENRQFSFVMLEQLETQAFFGKKVVEAYCFVRGLTGHIILLYLVCFFLFFFVEFVFSSPNILFPLSHLIMASETRLTQNIIPPEPIPLSASIRLGEILRPPHFSYQWITNPYALLHPLEVLPCFGHSTAPIPHT